MYLLKNVLKPYISWHQNVQSVTVVSGGNALGQVIPPVTVLRGQLNKPEFSQNLPLWSKPFVTAKGSMT